MAEGGGGVKPTAGMYQEPGYENREISPELSSPAVNNAPHLMEGP